MALAKENFYEPFGYVVEVSSLQQKGNFHFINGKLKVPVWEGKGEDIYIPFSAVQQDAIKLSKILKKGMGGIFGGELITKDFKGSDGKTHYITEFMVNEFTAIMSTEKHIPYRTDFKGMVILATNPKIEYQENKRTNEKFAVIKGRVACNALKHMGTLFSDFVFVGADAEKIYPYLQKGTVLYSKAHFLHPYENYTHLYFKSAQLVCSPEKNSKKEEKQEKSANGMAQELKETPTETYNALKLTKATISSADFKPKKGFQPIF